MSLIRLLATSLITLTSLSCAAQTDNDQNKPGVNCFYNSSITVQTDSGVQAVSVYRTICKGYVLLSGFGIAIPAVVKTSNIPPETISIVLPKAKKTSLFVIHGNVSYDFFYRSAIDTPISQRDFQQHTERVNLEVLVKNKFPLRVSFTARQSNSQYFRNFFDPNFQFDRFAYNRNIKQSLIDKLNAQLPDRPDLKQAEAALKEQLSRYMQLKNKLESKATLQKIIEEKERKYNKQLKNRNSAVKEKMPLLSKADSTLSMADKLKDSLTAKKESMTDIIDSTMTDFSFLYQKEKNKLDSLYRNIQVLQKKADSIKNRVQKEIITAKQKIYKATSEKELGKIVAEYGIAPERRGKFEKQLAAVKTFSIGRSMVNYTELTAQNIIITGLNIEYNPFLYIAFTAGKIDYRFRDFFNKNVGHNNQYLVMGRLGVGDKEKMALILSVFKGRKNTTAYGFSDSVKNYVNIMGYSLEAIYKKDENTAISAEFAKSTKPVSGNLQTGKQTGVLWNYGDRSNMGINIKAQTIIPETHTKLNGFYRKTGENFQSFSLFSYNTDQTAWLLRADQSFLKNKITLTTMLRRNDFSNPFTDKTYKTSTVFKSIILNVRFPKYPSLSLGYYPGTQLYIVDKEKIRENAYYILNGSLVYGYSLKNINMNSLFVYNRYTNKATDSGFQLYKGVNYYGAQSIFLRKMQVQAGYSYTSQPELEYYTVEGSGDYSFKKWLRLGLGTKYNKISGGDTYWGKSIQLTLNLKQLGNIQLQYEKSYLPTIQQTLYPVETGRISYYKKF